MSAGSKQKIFLVLGPGDEAQARLQKALSAFAELIVTESEDKEEIANLFLASGPVQNVFCLNSKFEMLQTTFAESNCILFATQDIPLEQTRTANKHFSKYPCLLIQALPTVEIMRICFALIAPKSSSGITHFFEKGAIVVAEKVQSLNTLGEILDRANKFILQERPGLVGRLLEIRQVLTSLIYESFAQSAKAGVSYPTVDLQFVANPEKFAFTLRFPSAGLSADQLKDSILGAKNFAWFMAWQASDIFFINEFTKTNEIEVKALLFSGRAYGEPSYRTLSVKSFANNEQSGSLLAPIKNFQFKTIMELSRDQLAQGDVPSGGATESTGDADLDAMPPAARAKIIQLESNIKQLHQQIERRVQQTQKGTELITKVKSQMVKQKGDFVIKEKESEKERARLKREIATIASRLDETKEKLKEQERAQENQDLKKLNERLEKYEKENQKLQRELELEKLKLTESGEDEKRSKSAMEGKEKEIKELRDSIAEYKKETQDAKAELAEVARKLEKAESDLKAALKKNDRESDSKDSALKQEVKSLKFKIEQIEKSKAAELAEKVKSYEKKLEAAKQKEQELVKKIESLKTGKDAA